MKTPLLIALIVIAALALMVLPGMLQNNSDEPVQQVLTENDNIIGSPDAPITLIEYSDFQCPACAAHHPLIKQITEDFNEEIVFAYRHFPLAQHIRAIPAAIASEAAGNQGKFFEMHDILFEQQDEWAKGELPANDYFIQYAETLELDIDEFKNDLEDEALAAIVREQLNQGRADGVNATPTFFVNGEKVSIRDYQTFANLVNAIVSEENTDEL